MDSTDDIGAAGRHRAALRSGAVPDGRRGVVFGAVRRAAVPPPGPAVRLPVVMLPAVGPGGGQPPVEPDVSAAPTVGPPAEPDFPPTGATLASTVAPPIVEPDLPARIPLQPTGARHARQDSAPAVVPFPGGEPTEEIPLWLPPDHRAGSRDARSVVSAAKNRARTSLGRATVVGAELDPVQPGGSMEPWHARDLLLDTTPGLAKFNIGGVPAPVTPPASWKRAAWFSFGSAGMVLASLVTVASVVQSGKQVEHRDALPDFPNVLVRTTPDEPPTVGGRTTGPHRGHALSPRPSTSTDPDAAADADPPRYPDDVVVVVDGSPSPLSPTPSTGASGPATTTTTSPPTTTSDTPSQTTPPSTVTQPGLLLSRDTRVEQLAPTTEKFFALASKNLRAAFDQYGSPALKKRGFAAFAKDFAGVARMAPTKIVVQSATGRTVTTLKVTFTDGRTGTQSRTLTFSSGDTPLVDDERQG